MKALLNPIKHCKICFEPIHDYSLFSFLNKNNIICEECFSKFNARFIHFNIGSIKGLSIYEYDETIKDLIFKFKGCYDIELKDVFLTRYLWYLKLIYKGYYALPIPSYYMDDERRGFNHVVEIFSGSNLEMLKIIKKTKNHKQAKQKRKERLSTKKNFELIDGHKITGKKILIVDDVYTTGSSVQAIIKLIKPYNPRKISVLVIAKNVLRPRK